jgi:SAM-dependent methyltransferase
VSQHYQQISHAFDQAARSYDDSYQSNRIMAWMRAQSLAALQAAFPPGSRLLEIGCGTGDEALALSRLGYQVVATDVSPEMIHTASAKAQASGDEGVIWRVLPAGQLPNLVQEVEPGSFDGAYSSYGALNCEPQLQAVASALAHLLSPGASWICSVMNRWCLWEIGWGLVHLRPREAFRRLGRDWIPAGLASDGGRLTVPTRYYNPYEFAQAFTPYFQVQTVRGLPVWLPPPYLDHLVTRHPTLFSRLQMLEFRLRDRFPFHSLGDHFLMRMVRRSERAA